MGLPDGHGSGSVLVRLESDRTVVSPHLQFLQWFGTLVIAMVSDLDTLPQLILSCNHCPDHYRAESDWDDDVEVS